MSLYTSVESDLRGSLSFLNFPLKPLRRAALVFPMAALASLTILLASCVVGSNRYSGTSRRCEAGAFLLRTLSCFRRSVQITVQHHNLQSLHENASVQKNQPNYPTDELCYLSPSDYLENELST